MSAAYELPAELRDSLVRELSRFADSMELVGTSFELDKPYQGMPSGDYYMRLTFGMRLRRHERTAS